MEIVLGFSSLERDPLLELMAELGAAFVVLCMNTTSEQCRDTRDVLNRLEVYLLTQEGFSLPPAFPGSGE